MVFGSLMFPGSTAKEGFTTASADSIKSNVCEFIYGFKGINGKTIPVINNVKILDESNGVVKIPSTIKVGDNVSPVTMVGNQCMRDNHSVKEVIFPESVTYIGTGVLRNSSVEKITLPDSLEHI